MGKRKNDKLETMYQNIDLKFKDASEEEIREEIARGNLQIEENNNEIEKLKETIKTKQQLIEALEGKDESETSPRIQKAIEDASKELEEAQNKLKDYELKILEIKNGETKTIFNISGGIICKLPGSQSDHKGKPRNIPDFINSLRIKS